MISPTTILLSLLASGARAQDFDASGQQPTPDSADVKDPILGFSGGTTGAPVISTTFETASDVLVNQVRQGDEAQDFSIVESTAGFTLAAQAGVYKGVGLGLSLPVWLFTAGEVGGGPTMGDIVLWVPIEIRDEESWGLGVVPHLLIPTGADARYLGEPGPGAGFVATGRGELSLFFAALDAGLDYATPTNLPEWPGGLHYRYATDIGVAPNEMFGLHFETRGRGPIASIAPTLPTEIMGTVKVQPFPQVWFHGSAGRALTRGIGASGLRMFLGMTVATSTQEVEAELVTAPPPKEIHLVDDRGLPIFGAKVSAGGVEVVSDPEGYALLPVRSVRDGQIIIDHPHYERVELDVNPDAPFWQVELERLPVLVSASVVGPEGSLALVEVEVDGPYDPGPPDIDEAGVHNWRLEPGTWKVRMSSPGLGSQERTIVIKPARTEPIRVDAVLAAALETSNVVRVEVVDRFGRPVEDAVVALGDRDLGTTGTGGDLTVEGLTAGAGSLTIRADSIGEGAVFDLVVPEEGDQVVQAVVDWRPGSVVVQAVDQRGKPIDADVTFTGPANLPSRSIGSDGSEVVTIRPGTWEVEVSAPGFGTQRRTVEVTGEPGELSVVDVDFYVAERGDSDLKIRVVDVDGNSVSDVDLLLDGAPVGASGAAGDLVLTDLDEGTRTLQAVGEGVVASERRVDLVDGDQVTDIVVQWEDGATSIATQGVFGRPIDAKVKFTGPSEVPESNLGPEGAAQFMLTPGEWTVEISASGHETVTHDFTVAEGTGRLNKLDFTMAPEGTEALPPDEVEDRPGGLEVAVQGPDGTPLDAKVTLRDSSGVAPVNPKTALGGTAALDPGPGQYKLVVEAPGMKTQVVDVEVTEGEPVKLDVALEEPKQGDGATVLVKAETQRGDALVDADILVDGEVVGKTDWSGTWELVDVPKQGADVTIRPSDSTMHEAVTIPIDIRGKDQRQDSVIETAIVVPDAKKNLEVEVLDPFGNVVAAEVVAIRGTTEGGETRTGGGADGEIALAPGTWTITAVTESGEVATTEVVVAPSDPRAGGGGGIGLSNSDSEGRSLDGAAAVNFEGETPRLSMRVEQISASYTDGALVPVNPILFDTGQHVLRSDADSLIQDLARWLNTHREAALLEVGGHTDDIGGVAYNQQLSERRAKTVRQSLIDNGVAPERLVARGYGLSRPITANLDDASRQRNRRVALVVLDWSE